MIRSIYFTKDGVCLTDIPRQDYPAAVQDLEGLFWLDFEGTPPETDEPLLREVFGFHPLAIDDALQESHVPKVDDWEKYLYIVLHSVSFNHDADSELKTLELDIFLGENYVVTHHDKPIPAVDKVWSAAVRNGHHLKNGADHVVYRITDEVVASYMPVVEELDEAIDHAEDEVFDQPTSKTLENIFQLKRAVLHLRRIVGPQREVLNKLARDDYQVIDPRDRVYFRDVYDHLVRLYDITESIRDLVGGALDTYLSVINNRMNDIVKTLTVITTLFMPIGFLASFFGMNFFQPVSDSLKPWTSSPVFMIVMLVTILAPAGMFLWIRRRGWM
jgi:magnesium transporter